MKAKDIIWDVDYEEDLETLPKEIEIPEGMEDEEEISDYLSDVTGFCHKGFKLEENKALNIDDQIINASTHNERLYITDITGVIGEWLDMDHQDIEPEIIKKLEDVYQMAVKELEEPLKKPIKGDNKAR